MKVSVIIPCYNAGSYLVQAVSSVRAQKTSFPLTSEIIVIDDDSPDGCVEQLDGGSDLKILHQEHQGAATARNYGMREATGEYLLFLDDDDKLVPDAVETLYQGLLQNESDVVLGMAEDFISEEFNCRSCRILIEKRSSFRFISFRLLFWEKGSGFGSWLF